MHEDINAHQVLVAALICAEFFCFASHLFHLDYVCAANTAESKHAWQALTINFSP
uniref:Secreted protein n=1 Tax=Ascaris lumbricoides TaxID=6252 RepID=A0A0M3IF63_ASCLU